MPQYASAYFVRRLYMDSSWGYHSAKEMIEESTKLGNSYCAKRHCIWLCDEIIGSCFHPKLSYWQEVKREIEKS